MFKGGYKGKLLRIDLSGKSYKTEDIDPKIVTLLLGGRGVAAKYYYDEIAPDIKPFSKENKIIFMTGPLTGAPVYASTKWQLATKSPLTNMYCCSNSSGFFGPNLKKSGYDGIIVEGKADKPVYISIFDDKVEFHDASGVWGLKTGETDDALKAKFDNNKLSVLSIGPGGENLVRYADIQVDKRSFGRGGAGAIMGDKNLKAMVCFGTGEIELADAAPLKEYIAANMKKTKDGKPVHTKYGTAQYTEVINDLGCYPTNNFQTAVFKNAEGIYATTMAEKYKKKNYACYRCPVACGQVCEVDEGPFKGAISRPEFENIGSLGAQCGNRDFAAIIAGNMLCDEYGLDAMQTGTVIAFAMELYEKGLITKEDTDGLELDFGNGEAMVKMIEKIGLKDGKLAELLGFNYFEIAEKHPEYEYYMMHAKGLAFAAYDPRGFYGMGLAYGTSSRGACHNVGGWTIRAELTSGDYDRFAIKGKGKMVKDIQDTRAYVDSVGVCTVIRSGLGFTDDPHGKVLEWVTGEEFTPRLMEIAERIYDFERVILNREGKTRKDDYLPRRMSEEELPEGMAKGSKLTRDMYDVMLDEYYEARGWDSDGKPTPEKLKLMKIDQLM